LIPRPKSIATRYAIPEHKIVLGFVFVCLPLLDMVNGVLVVRGYLAEGGLASPSQLGRLIATVIMIIACRRSKISLFWIVVISGIFLIETLTGIMTNSVMGTLFGFITVYRIFFIYLLFVVFTKYLLSDISVIAKYLKLNLNLICLSIIFGSVTGLGNSTYGWGFGTKGFFASGNGLGVYIGVAAILLFGMRYYKLYKAGYNLTGFLAVGALLLVGTKTALVLSLVIMFLIMWTSKLRIILLASITCGIIYFKSQILSSLGLVFDVILLRYNNSTSFLNFAGSGRIDYVNNAFETLSAQNVSALRWLFGKGSYFSFQNPTVSTGYDTLETDPFDVLFMYGIYGFSIYVAVLLITVRMNLSRPYILLGLVFLIVHSIVAGHVIFNGMSVTLLAAFMALGRVSRNNYTQAKLEDKKCNF